MLPHIFKGNYTVGGKAITRLRPARIFPQHCKSNKSWMAHSLDKVGRRSVGAGESVRIFSLKIVISNKSKTPNISTKFAGVVFLMAKKNRNKKKDIKRQLRTQQKIYDRSLVLLFQGKTRD